MGFKNLINGIIKIFDSHSNEDNNAGRTKIPQNSSTTKLSDVQNELSEVNFIEEIDTLSQPQPNYSIEELISYKQQLENDYNFRKAHTMTRHYGNNIGQFMKQKENIFDAIKQHPNYEASQQQLNQLYNAKIMIEESYENRQNYLAITINKLTEIQQLNQQILVNDRDTLNTLNLESQDQITKLNNLYNVDFPQIPNTIKDIKNAFQHYNFQPQLTFSHVERLQMQHVQQVAQQHSITN